MSAEIPAETPATTHSPNSIRMAATARPGGIGNTIPVVYDMAPWIIVSLLDDAQDKIKRTGGTPFDGGVSFSPRRARILDFGAGPDDSWVVSIHDRLSSFLWRHEMKDWAFHATDQGPNFNKNCHVDVLVNDQDFPSVKVAAPAFLGRYDVVLLSNVLNVQADRADVSDIGAIVRDLLKPGGIVLWNYPSAPRHAGLTRAQVEALAFPKLLGWNRFDIDSVVFRFSPDLKSPSKRGLFASQMQY